jgi:hypothetical protein
MFGFADCIMQIMYVHTENIAHVWVRSMSGYTGITWGPWVNAAIPNAVSQESGTWNAAIISGASLTVASPQGNFVRQGSLVNVHNSFTATRSGTTATTPVFGGLPFAPVRAAILGPVRAANAPANNTVYARVTTNSRFELVDARGTIIAMDALGLGTNGASTTIEITGTYQIA